MGLDITAYSRVAIENDAEVDEEGYPVEWRKFRKVWVNPDFPGRADDIKHGAIYSFTDKFSFRAGGYGYYSQWREQLAKVAGYPLTEYREDYSTRRMHAAACWKGATGPFSELIMFADNQGVLGSSVCAKLAKDFAEHEASARAFSADPEGDSDFIVSYLEWKQAFELAADGGMVDFH